MKSQIKNIDGQAVTGFVVVSGLSLSVLGMICFMVIGLR